MPALDRKWWTLIAVCTATFMLLLDITVVNVALPDIQRSLHATLQRHPVGRRRLLADARRVPPHRRGARRHVRTARGVRHRARRLLRVLAGVRAGHLLAHAQPVEGAPRASAAPSCSPPRWPSSPARSRGRERGTAFGIYGAVARRCGGGRAAGRRGHHQRDRLAVDLLRQRPHRRGGRRHHPDQDPGVEGPQHPADRLDRVHLVLPAPCSCWSSRSSAAATTAGPAR